MKNYILILLFIFIGCKNDSSKTKTIEKQIITKNLFEDVHSLDVNIDSSIIKWIGKKIYKSHDGILKFKSGNIYIEDDQIVGGELIVDMNSLVCTDIKKEGPNQGLVNHLKNEDFFDVPKYPLSKIKILSSEKKSNNEYYFNAELTIKGITNIINFNGLINKNTTSYHSNIKLSFDRTLWDIKYGSGKFFEELGDRAILDEIELDINLVAIPNSQE